MKKIIFKTFLFLVLLLTTCQSFATWYGAHSVAYSKGGGVGSCAGTTCQGESSPKVTLCGGDNQYDNGTTGETRSQVTGWSGGQNGTMTCDYWDGANPDQGSVSYTSGWTNSSKSISVQARDRGGSRLSSITLQQSQNGGGWSTVSTWNSLNSLNTIVSRSWTRTASHGNNFKYRIIAVDYAGNSTVTTNNNLISFDISIPTAIISSSSHSDGGWSNDNTPTFTIAGTNQGPSPVTRRQYCVDTAGICNPNINYTGTKTLSALPDGIHFIRSAVTDTGGTGIHSFQINIDTVKPSSNTVTIIGTINNGGGASTSFTYTPSITLTLGSNGGLSSNYQMSFSCNNSNWTGWEAYNTSKAINISSAVTGCNNIESASKRIYVRYRDGALNVSVSATDTINYDRTNPTANSITIRGTINNGGGSSTIYTYTPSVTLLLSSNGGLSNNNQMSFSCNNSNWTGWEAYNTSKSINMSSATTGCNNTENANKLMYVRFKDNAGNISTLSDTIIYDRTNPTPNSITIRGTINNGGGSSTSYTYTPLVRLLLSSNGGLSANNTMSFSCNNANWTGWEGYNTFKDINMSNLAGAGCNNTESLTKTVYVKFKDNAGNITLLSDNIVYDYTAPVPGDITDSLLVSNGDKLLAGTHGYTTTVGTAGGSPIILIESKIEDNIDDSKYNSTLITSVNSTLNITAVMEEVDDFRIDPDGHRRFSFKYTKIQDAAGNLIEVTDPAELNNPDNNWTTLPKYIYYVFADSDTVATKNVTINDLNIGNVADGTNELLRFELKDSYGNGIIKADDINREIDINFIVRNKLKLNQYTTAASDGVFISDANNAGSIMNGKLSSGPLGNTFADEISTDGIYNYYFNIYTPTYSPTGSDGQKYADGDMFIDNIKFTIRQNLVVGGDKPEEDIDLNEVSGTIKFDFNALFVSEFRGKLDMFETDGNPIPAGLDHTSQVRVRKTVGSTATITSGGLYLEFGETNSGANVLNPKYDLLYDYVSAIEEGNQPGVNGILNLQQIQNLPTSSGSPTNSSFNVNIDTVLTTAQLTANYISTHVAYKMSAIPDLIAYDSDIINKPRYSSGTTSINTSQIGLKVYGKIQSKAYMDLTNNQSPNDLSKLGNNAKAGLKELIHKNTTNATRNITPTNNTGLITDLFGIKWADNLNGTKLKNDTVMYYNLAPGTNLEIGNGTDLVAQGVKTLVVKGGNVYIKNNITYNNNSTDMLGIIALEDNNIGGNIYIHPSVTHISGTYYADRSMLNYNGSIINWSQPTLLKNQLYIYGTLFSENNIGGSLIPKCPYYITGPCDANIAKLYDLNFMRRYVLVGGTPYPAGAQAYSGSPLPQKHPMVIKYNGKIQSTPPPLFSTED